MSLEVQIESIALSFLFGMIYSLFYNLLYYLLYTKYTVINLINNIFFNLVMFSLYYYLLYLVNDGCIHVYFLIVLFISCLLYNKLYVKLRVKWLKNRLN